MKSLKFSLVCAVLVWACVACFKMIKTSTPMEIDFTKLPYKNLSEYGFFKGEINELEANESVLLYEPISTLFTDYAFKTRFVWMPKGSKANFDINDQDKPLDFPENTILIKNFYFPEDFSKPEGQRKVMETRLLVKGKDKWEAYPYKWTEDQKDAKYKSTGGIFPASWKDENGEKHEIKYVMPNKNQCKSCHNRNGTFSPIGPKIKQLNHVIAYGEEKRNQLEKWVEVGYLNGLPDQSKINGLKNMKDPRASLDAKARSYLDANCGHCHSTYGSAASSGLRLNYEIEEPYHWGVKKSPVAAGIGAGDFKYDIYPGHGMQSILTYRMNSTHPGIMMPEIGRVSVHKEGVELIARWIDSLKE
jgi:uncharacterized repeat protein (TIGR03806 family)